MRNTKTNKKGGSIADWPGKSLRSQVVDKRNRLEPAGTKELETHTHKKRTVHFWLLFCLCAIRAQISIVQ